MAKKYTYYNLRNNKVLFESIEPNYVQIEDMDKKVAEHIEHDPRLNPWIGREVVRVDD